MSTNSGSLGSTPPSFEKRLPLALALMMLVLIVSQYLFKPAPGPKPLAKVNDRVATTVTQQPDASTTAASAAVIPAPAGAIQASSETTSTVDTTLYKIVFSNRGAVVKSWVLKKFQDESGKPLELINPAAKDVPLPFAIQIKSQQITVDPNTALYQAKRTPDGLGIMYEYSDGRTSIRKSFTFGQDSYLADVKSRVLLNGTPVPHFVEWRGGFGDQNVRNAAQNEHTIRYDASAGKRDDPRGPKDAKDGPVTDSGNFSFAGLEDNFFAAVALPTNPGFLEIRTFSDSIKIPNEDKPILFVGAGLGTGAENSFSLFVGPKDIDILKKVNSKLEQIVDWGFFGVIAKPLFLWLNWMHDHVTNNFGWAIILVTLIINLALFPLRLSSLKSARRMQKLQPQIQAINAKYKNVSLRDPKKSEQNQEVMDLYKKEGVNPVGGCLPMLIQLPFFYAFYKVLSIAIELRHAPWLWVPDLSAPESLPIHLLPIILIATQFLTQRMTPAAGVDPNQQKMMMMMPLFFGFMFYYASAGLVLYWLTGNLVGIAQQLLINRMMPSPPPVAPVALSKAPVRKVVKK